MKKTPDVDVLGHPAVGKRQRQVSAAKLAAKLTYGAKRNSIASAPAGMKSSLASSLMPSARRLQPAELAADAGRSQPILDAAGDLTFQPDEEHRPGATTPPIIAPRGSATPAHRRAPPVNPRNCVRTRPPSSLATSSPSPVAPPRSQAPAWERTSRQAPLGRQRDSTPLPTITLS